MELEDKIWITDENGEEKEYTILFTFDSEEFEKSYVLFFDEEDEEGNVNAMSYDDEGNLEEISSLEEWDLIEEMFNTFIADEDEEIEEVEE